MNHFSFHASWLMLYFECCTVVDSTQHITHVGPLHCTDTVFLLPSATKLRWLCFHTCLSVHRGGVLPQCRDTTPPPQQAPPPGADIPRYPRSGTPWSRHPPQKQTPNPANPADSYCCGQYASYWNAFLFQFEMLEEKNGKFLKITI